MIRDLNDNQEPEECSADVCIIGGGAAGIALARELKGSGYRTIILEGGGVSREPETDDLYRSVVEGRSHTGVHTGRARVLGGTTTLWGGQALPLHPLDMQRREWVPHSGWPITNDDIARYYPRVLRLLKLEENDFTRQIRHIRRRVSPNFSADLLDLVYSQWSPTPNFATAYRQELASTPDVDVWLHANVTELLLNPNGDSISHAEVRSLRERRARVSAKFFVICCGGIETARLLLASRSRFPNGIGNEHDLVGRFFQDHIAIQCGLIRPRNRKSFCNIFDQSLDHGVKFYPKLVAAEELQRRHQILSVIGNCYTVLDPNSGISQAKTLASDLRSRRWDKVTFGGFLAALRAGRELLPAGWRLLAQRRIYSSPNGTMYLEAHVEQEPDPESRILLSSECVDALGMPRTVVRWRPSAASVRSARIFAEVVAREFARLGFADIEMTLPSDGDSAAWENLCGDLNHHMGTARMSEDPSQGVTDPHCVVHGVQNLFVASSAVFPTSGSSNPTFTLLALTYRIADELRRLLR
jgi:choline dehydrogenase-like flavoprotein